MASPLAVCNDHAFGVIILEGYIPLLLQGIA